MIVSCINCGRKIEVPDNLPCPMDGYCCGECSRPIVGRYGWAKRIMDTPAPVSRKKVCPYCKGMGVVDKEENET